MNRYFGYVEKQFADMDEQIAFYNNPCDNIFNLFDNEYVILRNGEGEIIDKMKWNGERHVPISYRQLDNIFYGKIKPRNLQQELMFDLLQDKKTTVKIVDGKAGSGKDMLMSATAIDLIDKGIFSQVVWLRNTVEVKNSKPIGFLPGEKEEKLLPFAMPLADHVGGPCGLERLIREGKVEVQHLGHIRGRDIKNSIVICSESENLTSDHAQLLISRIGEGSSLWMNGDFCQTDDKIFERDNGLEAMIECLKGQKLFGYVHLVKTERSETAALADLLDNYKKLKHSI